MQYHEEPVCQYATFDTLLMESAFMINVWDKCNFGTVLTPPQCTLYNQHWKNYRETVFILGPIFTQLQVGG